MKRLVSKRGLKSVPAEKPLRSRGFLSQPGGQQPGADNGTECTEAGKPNKSRGQRQPIVTGTGTPETLATKASIRRYKLEDK
ncbi:hypothetical protein [Roseibium sp.]|uniref:hypothetical protein n=1 Tax=Roseibium sp. TaxID=1936156 RepID=UPI003B52568A